MREYNAQDVANTLWAYAKMGSAQAKRVMGLLEERVGEVAREYKAQGAKRGEHAVGVREDGKGDRGVGGGV